MKKIWLPAMALTVALVGTAMADDDMDGEKRGFRGEHKKERHLPMDTNKDGFVSKAEMKAAHEKRMNEHFNAADANNDGKLSPEELREGRKKARAKMKARYKEHKEKMGERKQKREEWKAKRAEREAGGE